MFEEDTSENLRICLAMAPVHCDACGDFHISVAVRRTTDSQVGMTYDRDVFVSQLAEGLRARLAQARPLSVLIAGAADTAILRLVVEAAEQVGGEAVARQLAVTVLDLCETPLEMCRRYGGKHGLAVDTVRSDIGSFEPTTRFGLVAMHGVLPFFPQDRRLDYMRRIVGWLDVGGMVVSASQIAETVNRGEIEARYARQTAALDAFLAREGAGIDVDVEAMRKRIRRSLVTRRQHPRLFDDEGALDRFYAAAGLELVQREIIDLEGGAALRYPQRAVVLARAAQR